MKLSELKAMIETAEQLGCGNAELVLIDGRDGVASYPKARAEFIRGGDQREPFIFLGFGRAGDEQVWEF